MIYLIILVICAISLVYAIDINATLVSIEENPNIPVLFNITNGTYIGEQQNPSIPIQFNITNGTYFGTEQNPNVPIQFNIINATYIETNKPYLSIKKFVSKVYRQNQNRIIESVLKVDSAYDVYCKLVGYDPINNLYNYSYTPQSIIINGTRYDYASIFKLSSGVINLTIIDEGSNVNVILECIIPQIAVYNNLNIQGYFKSNLLQFTKSSYLFKMFFTYSMPITITYLSDFVESIVVPLSINTKELISKGYMKSDCSDIYFSLYIPSNDTEIPLDFWLDPATCNTNNTVVYIKVPELFVGRDIFINMYFGSTTNIYFADPYNTFYWFVNFANRGDYYKIQLFYNNSEYKITSGGLEISVKEGGALVIYNK